MSRDLDAGAAAVQFVVAGYAVALAAGLIIGGRLGDILGRRRVFGIGMAGFAAASLLCGLATDPGTLIAGRVAQGLAAALMAPQVLAIIGVVYTGAAKARAIGVFGVTAGLAAVFGQLIGGLLIEADIAGTDWRGCFLINVPVAIIALSLLRGRVPAVPGAGHARLDLPGAVLVAATLVAVVLPLSIGQDRDWPLWTFLTLAAAVPLGAGLIAWQRRLAGRGGQPLVHLGLFGERAFTAGMLIQVVFWMGMASFFLVFALYMQAGRGLTALEAGTFFVIGGLGYFATSSSAPRIAARLGRQVLALGAVCMVAGLIGMRLALSQIGVDGSLVWLAPWFALDGAGMGLIMAPLATIVLAGVTPKHVGAASGVLATGQYVGGALGVAVVGVVFYGTVDTDGHAEALGDSLVLLAVLAAGVAVLTQLLPRPDRRS